MRRRVVRKAGRRLRGTRCKAYSANAGSGFVNQQGAWQVKGWTDYTEHIGQSIYRTASSHYYSKLINHWASMIPHCRRPFGPLQTLHAQRVMTAALVPRVHGIKQSGCIFFFLLGLAVWRRKRLASQVAGINEIGRHTHQTEHTLNAVARNAQKVLYTSLEYPRRGRPR